jgi:hypothetical protein
MNETTQAARRDAAQAGAVAHLSEGGWTHYHRLDCPEAPQRRDPGVRHVVHGPWRYLAAHWQPCPRCRPPAPALSTAA